VLSTPAFAQSGEELNTGDIVVTARRVEERLQDVPISITVLNQGEISNRNITTATELATYTPSLTTNARFGADKASFAIRGFSQIDTTSPTVGVYFADVVALRANAGTTSGNGAGPGAFFDLQNVQVLKGPQGTLFGRNTTGGAILLVPQRPTDRLEGFVEGSIGNYDLRRVQAVLNIPLADTFKVRLGLDRQKRDGYLRNQSSIGPKTFSDSNYLSVRASILGELTPDLENYFVGRYSRSNTNGLKMRLIACNDGSRITLPNGTLQAPPAGRATIYAPPACAQLARQNARGDGFYDVENDVINPFNILDEWQLINTTTWKAADNLTIKNIASYGEFHERFWLSIGGERLLVASGPNAGKSFPATIIRNAPGQYGAAQSTFTEELQFQGQLGDNRLIWQAGGYLEISHPLSGGNTTYSESGITCVNSHAFQCEAVIPQALGPALGIVKNRAFFRNIGIYGQATYNFSDQFAVTGGLRYTMDRTEGYGGRLTVTFPTPNNPVGFCANPKILPGVQLLDFNRCTSGPFVSKSNKPTWLVDVEYKPVPDIMVYAKYARGYRQGAVNASNIGLETWLPEKIDNYEIGAKASFSGAIRGYFNIAGFWNELKDQQLSVTVIGKPGSGIPGARVIVNAGASRVRGIEVDASVTAFDSLKLDVGYAYLDTILKEFNPRPLPADSPFNPPAAVATGTDLPFSPKHRVTATLTYTLPLDESIGVISFGGTFVHTTSQFADLQSPFGLMPKSDLVNLNLNWNSVAGLPVDLAAFVTNLTKEKFPVNVANNYASNGFEAVVTNVPRMYGLRLKYRFGR
jgi:iron complex outermembrane receptor protein